MHAFAFVLFSTCFGMYMYFTVFCRVEEDIACCLTLFVFLMYCGYLYVVSHLCRYYIENTR